MFVVHRSQKRVSGSCNRPKRVTRTVASTPALRIHDGSPGCSTLRATGSIGQGSGCSISPTAKARASGARQFVTDGRNYGSSWPVRHDLFSPSRELLEPISLSLMRGTMEVLGQSGTTNFAKSGIFGARQLVTDERDYGGSRPVRRGLFLPSQSFSWLLATGQGRFGGHWSEVGLVGR
ncbi:hypothetical protein KQX54_009143 [Cotesia glomerata]|uniref:Uncharacterized protein n=1 Tax=Cotesia glomerata TaxID=32391 RepID=A0AAV7I588_COTGL|nr:hypothetical protein KQX54_009143 [Cotesia glomerata]